ncbi:MAG: leucine--tRNA ligase [Deltaproteobacteria bacterium]|nr:leucine--tRNA ligase [Myxococcales bacterium]MDP3213467.1 leucine--tRNA ligase [Deltaproteobacteria bacterium]
MPYRPSEIEPLWQAHWESHDSYVARIVPGQPKFYALDMFPYPSGKGLHVGHPAGYTASDVVCRYKRARGFNVLHPIGYDAFGLPAEQRAIDEGIAPQVSTAEAIETFRRQLKRLGYSYDWSREISTADPSYYKWTQWIFTRLYARGVAYVGEGFVNWCPALGTVLANDEVIDGKSERGGHPVERKRMSQWMLRISAYADRLLSGLDTIDWPEATKTAQREWIGRSEGAFVDFAVEGSAEKVTVFTTRPDTLFGATYLVLAPEHALVDGFTTAAQREAVAAYQKRTAGRSERDRQATKEKTGVDTGARAINPATGEAIPVWIADYVIAGYGTGAIMAVPGHDERDWEFAKAMGLPIREVITGGDVAKAAYAGDGVMVHSGRFDGTATAGGEAIRAVTAWLAEQGCARPTVNFKIRDWTFARQRYWGEPIPVLKDGDAVVRALTPDELPLVLPPVAEYAPTGSGESPLARAVDWLDVDDPVTGRRLRREVDTMPGSAGSSWYFLRYCDPHNDQEFCSREASDYWMPVDLYVGGAEHRVGHLLYSRMWQKALHEEGFVRDEEPFAKLRHQGMVLAKTFYTAGESGRFNHLTIPASVEKDDDKAAVIRVPGSDEPVAAEVRWEKMSKRKGNVVNPDDIIDLYGVDALRVYLCFLTPLESDKPWQTSQLEAQHDWLKRVWRLYFEGDDDAPRATDAAPTADELKILHRAVDKVGRDIEALTLNTAISALHVATRDLARLGTRSREVLGPLAQLVAPFAPHLAETLWTRGAGNDVTPGGVAYAPWPEADPKWLVDDTVTIGVQVNGKTVTTVELALDADEATAVAAAKAIDAVARQLAGKSVAKVIYKSGKILNLIAK